MSGGTKGQLKELKCQVRKDIKRFLVERSRVVVMTIYNVSDNDSTLYDSTYRELVQLNSKQESRSHMYLEETLTKADKKEKKDDKTTRKRSYYDEKDREKDSKRARTKGNRPYKRQIKDENDVIRKESTEGNAESDVSAESPGQIQAQQIKDIMAKAQAVIEERKKAMSIQPSTNGAAGVPGMILPTPGGLPPGGLNSFGLPNSSDVNSRIAQLQARIQAQIGSTAIPALQVPMAAPPLPIDMAQVTAEVQSKHHNMAAAAAAAAAACEQSKPTPLILDDEGKTVDSTGREVHLTTRIPTLKANIRAKKREEFKQQLNEKPVDDVGENSFFDYRVSTRPTQRTKRMFKFHEHGKFIQVAQRERAKSRLDKLQTEISKVAKKTGILSAAKLAQLEQREQKEEYQEGVPQMEWWDTVIVESGSYPDDDGEVDVKNISSLIEHPMEMRCPSDPTKPVDLQVFLTKQERKKLRRMNRREAWKEKVEKIRLGLEPPPEPKVRMANLMRVLGTEAVIDPTKMEKHVREQMEKRLKAHQDANQARKLTPDQRRDKKMSKIKEDTTTGVHVAVFKVTDFSNGSHKFKVETNAKQLFMTGTVVLFRDVNVVVVEGGPKQQKKYKRLMMDRIKWAEESRSKDAELESKCLLVWEGVKPDRSFGDVQFKACPTETFARDHFRKHGVEEYWDLAYGRKILEETEDGV
ncbi:unnamed protein product, partial [Meganyctiphanes norvegica]